MHRYIVDSVEQITPTTILLNLIKPEGERSFTFQPGQYAAISFYRSHRPTPARCFSVVSSPTSPDILQFSMRAKGHFTKAITGLKKGDIVKVRGPYGGFVLDLARDGDTILLAGGIGITPFMSMIHYANSVKSTSNITLVYSCQNQDDIPFFNDLVNIEKQNPHFKVVFVIGKGLTNKLSGRKVYSGMISPELLDSILYKKYNSQTFFICGPPPFMRSMVKTLRSKGTTQNRIITEAFAQGSHRQTGKIRSWPYNIYVLSAVGVALGSFVVMVSDLLKTLPPSSIIGSSNMLTKPLLKSARQEDLDALVNSLEPNTNNAPQSTAVKAANASASAAQKTSTVTSQSSASTQTKTSKTTSAATVATPTPTPTKTCTTTQSGVTTCI